MFKVFCSNSIVDSEQVNISWVGDLKIIKILRKDQIKITTFIKKTKLIRICRA